MPGCLVSLQNFYPCHQHKCHTFRHRNRKRLHRLGAESIIVWMDAHKGKVCTAVGGLSPGIVGVIADPDLMHVTSPSKLLLKAVSDATMWDGGYDCSSGDVDKCSMCLQSFCPQWQPCGPPSSPEDSPSASWPLCALKRMKQLDTSFPPKCKHFLRAPNRSVFIHVWCTLDGGPWKDQSGVLIEWIARRCGARARSFPQSSNLPLQSPAAIPVGGTSGSGDRCSMSVSAQEAETLHLLQHRTKFCFRSHHLPFLQSPVLCCHSVLDHLDERIMRAESTTPNSSLWKRGIQKLKGSKRKIVNNIPTGKTDEDSGAGEFFKGSLTGTCGI